MRAVKAKKMRQQAKISAELEGVSKENKYEFVRGMKVLSNCERALYKQIKKYNSQKNSGQKPE